MNARYQPRDTIIGTRLFFSLLDIVGRIARNNLKFALAEYVPPICKYIFEYIFSLKQRSLREWGDKIGERRKRNQNSLSQVFRNWKFVRVP